MKAPQVHETAVVDEGARLGDGTKIWHFCHILSGAEIGRDVVLGQNGFVASRVVVGDSCRIQNNVSLYDGVVLERGVFVGPSAVFTNVRRPRALFPRKGEFEETRVGEGATLGANCTVVCGVNVGRFAMIGAGSTVVEDVSDYALCVGNPARHMGWVCCCGEALALPMEAAEAEATCARCQRNYRLGAGGVEETVK